MLEHISAGRLNADRVKAYLNVAWREFADQALATKQNSGVFWGFQKRWITQLEDSLNLQALQYSNGPSA